MVGKILLLVAFGGLAVFESVKFVQALIKYCKSRKEKPPNVSEKEKLK